MKTINNITIWLLATMVIVGQSCSGFLDVDPPNQISSETFFNSEDDYQQALIGAYDLLQSTYVNVLMGEFASDNTLCGGENANDVPGFQEIDDMRHSPVNSNLQDLWNWMYAGVNRCNYIFEFQNKTDFENKDQVLGQAAFLRAYYFFELTKWFGDIPMPVDVRVSFGSVQDYGREPQANVYAQIESDLQYAASVLPTTWDQQGRVTQGAAQSLLGKVLVYQGKYTEATVVLDEVITSNNYNLYDDYDALFTQVAENSIESVFEIQYSNEQGAGFGCLQCSEGNVAVGFSGIRGYNGPTYASGFSFNIPVQDLVDQFTPGDKRFKATILDIEAYKADQESQGEQVSYGEGWEHTRTGEAFQDPNLTNSTNYRAIRFSDVLLLAAEAHNAIGNDPKAQEYVNRIRSRAGLSDLVTTSGSLEQDIQQERRLELAGEGHRFFDLVRRGEAATKIPGFIAGTHELFPIPLVEIEVAGNIWAQNPGY